MQNAVIIASIVRDRNADRAREAELERLRRIALAARRDRHARALAGGAPRRRPRLGLRPRVS
jgi:ABC-type polar amino acid transport system ATPase subunit